MEKSTENRGSPEKEVEMVKALRIRTVYTDPKVLEKIADKVHEGGLVSGFSIQPIESGYFKEGKRVVERQYELDFLLNPNLPEEKKESIMRLINQEIGDKWETPAITQETVDINKDLLGFVKRAEVEYQRYKKEKRVRLSLTLALLLSISGIIGEASKWYVEHREEKAVATERQKEFERLNGIHQKIQKQIGDIELKLEMGKPLEKIPGVEFGGDYYTELHDIEKTVEEGTDSVRKLLKLEESKSNTTKEKPR